MLFAGCFNEEYDESSVGEMSSDAATSSDDRDNSDTNQSDNDSWAVYWYLCGSDLESENGAATADLMEMLEVELPENVSVVIQTGGASSWDNDTVSPNVIGRYLSMSTDFSKSMNSLRRTWAKHRLLPIS